MVSLQNIYEINDIQTEQIMFKNICVYAYKHALRISEKKAIYLNDNGEEWTGDSEGRKRKREML